MKYYYYAWRMKGIRGRLNVIYTCFKPSFDILNPTQKIEFLSDTHGVLLPSRKHQSCIHYVLSRHVTMSISKQEIIYFLSSPIFCFYCSLKLQEAVNTQLPAHVSENLDKTLARIKHVNNSVSLHNFIDI